MNMSRIDRAIERYSWNESLHPRDDIGRFTSTDDRSRESAKADVDQVNSILSRYDHPMRAEISEEDDGFDSTINPLDVSQADRDVRAANKILENYGLQATIGEDDGTWGPSIDGSVFETEELAAIHSEVSKINKRLSQFGLEPKVSIDFDPGPVPSHNLEEIESALKILSSFRKKPD